MTITAKTLVESTQLTTSAVTQYTAPGATRAIIDKCTVANVTGTAATVTLYLVASAGTAGTTNTISFQKSIAAGYTDTLPEIVGHVLNTGDFISALAGTATALNLRVSGREVV